VPVTFSNVSPYVLQRQQWVPRPIEDVFAFFSDSKNLEEITPAWLGFRIPSPEPIDLRPGARIYYRISLHGFPLRWVTEIESWDPPYEFVDVQARGPYRLWHHTHSFEPVDGGTLMRDLVRYVLPFGLLGCLAHAWLVKPDLEAIFDYRTLRISEVLGPCCAHE
jgi:ligand-binding SRPBCC domain-containing protein